MSARWKRCVPRGVNYLKAYLWLIRLIGALIPRRLRADWRQEWESELRNREAMLEDWDRLNWRARLDLFRRSASAFWDALWLLPLRWEDEMIQDLRFGVRMLWKNPGFTLIAVFTLSLGIGGATAIFSAVNPILFEPLPYPHASQVMSVWDHGANGSPLYVTFGTYCELEERSRSFESLAVMRPWQPTLTGATQPERFEGQRVSADYFRALGVSPTLGRGFQALDDQPNGPKAAILSDGLWRRRFGADPSLIGRQITLDERSYTVIGVMPGAFENVLASSAELWTPLQYDRSLPAEGREWGHHLRMVGRLRAGIGSEQARREIDTIARTPAPEFSRPPHANLSQGLIVSSLQDDVTSGVKPALLAVLGAVFLLLAIACVNVTNLLLARGAQRRGEFAVRAALGAGRWRLVRQLSAESLLLALLGGALGLALAVYGVQALVALSPAEAPRVSAIRIDGTVFAFALGLTALIGVAIGLLPALQASSADLRASMAKSSGRGSGARQWTRRTLVVVEVALAFVLLVSGGLLFGSMRRLFAIDPGFNPSGMLTLQSQVAGSRFDDKTTHRFFAQALEAVRQVPGVTSAAFTSQLPLSGGLEDGYGVRFESSPTGRPDADDGALRYAVSPGYFETMMIPLRRGRSLDARDVADAPLAVVISESLAKSKFPSQDPIGQRLRIGPSDGPWYSVVGVVGDVKQASLAASQSAAVYITTEQWRLGADKSLWLTVRTSGDPTNLAPAVRRAIWSVDKDQPIARVATMDSLLAATAAERRFALILFEAFGLVALALAVVGLYGVLSGSVAERTREIGVRMALGAQRRDVLNLILRQGVQLTFGGVGLGLMVAWAMTRMLATLLYGMSATDPLTFGGVALLLTLAALLACYLPARRATKVDPMVALRQE